MEPAITVTNLRKTFRLSAKQRKLERTDARTKTAVDGLTFEVRRGEIYGLLGPKMCIRDSRRHRADVASTLARALHELTWRFGDTVGTVGVTGSAGIGISGLLGLPFVQEVVATTTAVRREYPQADAIVELGGEDAKLVYLTHGLEQRMNATCAGGTGGFIDTMAFMLGLRTEELSKQALGAKRTYPIASRCAVFAQTRCV